MSREVEVCKTTVIHPEVIRRVLARFPKENHLNQLAEFFKIFGDPTRIKIIYALYESEMCVCDLAEVVGVSQSAISHQLRLLKQKNIVKFHREGKMVYYDLHDHHIVEILKSGSDHISHL